MAGNRDEILKRLTQYSNDIGLTTPKKKNRKEIYDSLYATMYGKAAPPERDTTNWFQESEGNIAQTVGGSATDLATHVGAGLAGMGETMLDAMAFLGPMAQQAQFNANGGYYNVGLSKMQDENYKKQKEASAEFIAKDLYDEQALAKALISDNVKKLTGIDSETMSVFGQKSDSLAQSAGQLLGAQAANLIAPGSGLAVMGTSAFGAEAQNALQQGATYEEAGLSATITAGAEMLTEKLSGAIKFGGKALDEVATKAFAANISNKLVQSLAKAGVDVAGEGFEEILSGYASAIGQKLTYANDKELSELFSSEDALESFVGGAVLGGVASGVKAGTSKATGTDYVTELTKNEEKVVNAITKERIAEAQKEGKKLSVREKTKIRTRVEAEMDDGSIDIDTIERILGGDDYKAYSSLTAEESRLQNEIEALKDAPNTIGNAEAIAEARRQLEDIQKNRKQSAKDKLSSNVENMIQNDRLVESYNERGRRGVAYEADLTQYSAKQQDTIRKAMESGILNNTNKTHKFVDFIAKISADKGVSFDFTDNQKLKESGFALQDRTVNGYIQGGNVTLNVNSAKALNKVVGHEITHVLEGTDLYTELQNTIVEYAKSKGDYDGRVKTLTELYKDIKDADINAELTADLVGDYLFSDPDFVKRLSVEKPGIFQRIYDEIKYLVKTATAGSKEAKQLREVQRVFEKAYQEKTNTSDNVKYSLQKDSKGKEYWHLDTQKDIFKGLNTTKEVEKAAYDYILKQRDNDVIVDAIDGKEMKFIRLSAEEFTNSEESKGLKATDPVMFAQKMRLIPSVEDLAQNANVNWWSPDKKNHKLFKQGGFENFRGRVQIDNVIFNYVIRSGKARFGDVFYDINLEVDQILPHTKDASEIKRSTSNNSISQNVKNATSISKSSLSSGDEELLPIRSDIYGKDIALDLDLPIRSDIAPVQEKVEFDDLPIRKDIVSKTLDDDLPIRKDLQQADAKKYTPKQTDYPAKKVKTVADRNEAKREALKVQLQEKQKLAEEVHNSYNREIASLQQEIERVDQLRIDSHAAFNRKMSQLRSEYDAKPDKATKVAQELLRQIESARVKSNEVETQYENQIYDLQGKIADKKRHRADSDANAEKAINDLKARIDKMNSKKFKIAEKRQTKQQEYRELFSNLIGDTSTWVDKKMGIYYKVNTLRRNLRDIVRDENGKQDYAKADAIYDELQGNYNHHEAQLNREANEIKKKFRDMKITKEEDAYIQMLGEYRHNPNTTILAETMTEYYNKHKDKIDAKKVDKIIDMARSMYDDLFVRLNEVLREQGMQEINYHKGYFPHFTEEKQSPLAKLLGWKTVSDNIPTDIAGLTENFNPDRSWQSFNKHRTGDSTDYSFMKGLDNYVQGSLDWIYHIEDIQKRRAFENEIRYRHSDKAIQDRLEEINQSEEYSAEEAQEMIDMVLKEARNPLNNFVSTFRTQTNTLAGKKRSMDRELEQDTNRRFYSTVTNLSNRVTANMVGGSVSSALTNFIPITQSWAEVSPISSLQGLKETIASYHTDDGTIDKSDFLTNRLRKNEALYKTGWDKAGEKIGLLMELCDNITSQTVWRSKYMENISAGMSENEAIKNADQFCENIMAGRSRGNAPAVFDSKNPIYKVMTAFQLEVNNQYGYMFKDLPQEMQNEGKGKLAAAYGKMFIGAYLYNALYSWMTGRDAAFDPIGIIEDVLRDMGLFGDDEEKEPGEVVGNFIGNVVEEIPFFGGLMGGGRIPISSALPYDGIGVDSIKNLITDISEGDMKSIWGELLNPVYYLVSPAGGGGQLRKTIEGLSMFSDDLPIAGSYTNSGKLRFSVEDTFLARAQAAVFGQYASPQAQQYFDDGRTPLSEKQIEELVDLDLPIADYWKYKDGMKGMTSLEDKADYIANLDLPISKKNIMINNQTDREEPIDLTDYDQYGSLKEMDFAKAQPGKYAVKKALGGYSACKEYDAAVNAIEADKVNGKTVHGSKQKKVISYINSLDISNEDKMLLYKSYYPSDDRYNKAIVEHLSDRDDISYSDKLKILEELGFKVGTDGKVRW